MVPSFLPIGTRKGHQSGTGNDDDVRGHNRSWQDPDRVGIRLQECYYRLYMHGRVRAGLYSSAQPVGNCAGQVPVGTTVRVYRCGVRCTLADTPQRTNNGADTLWIQQASFIS